MNDPVQVGTTVRFYSVIDRKEFITAKVTDLLPEGIPSCREPMVKLEGKPGYVLRSHCFVVAAPKGDEG